MVNPPQCDRRNVRASALFLQIVKGIWKQFVKYDFRESAIALERPKRTPFLVSLVASSHFQAHFANGLVGKKTRVFRGLAFVLKTEHVF
jgi:hypothetical protein